MSERHLDLWLTSETHNLLNSHHHLDYGINMSTPTSLHTKPTLSNPPSLHPPLLTSQSMSTPQTLPASSGTALLLKREQTVKVTNTHGRQVVDFWALNPPNPAEYLSTSHNHAIHRKLHFNSGDTLYSSISQAILS